MLFPVLLVTHSGCALQSALEAAVITKLERSITTSDMPRQYLAGQPPVITTYARYYFGYLANGRKMIRGEFVVPFGSGMKPAGVYMVKDATDFPIIDDGGCAVMQVVYDVEAEHIVSLKCNGLA